MNNKEMIDKYGITKKTGILILLQMMIMMGALVISLFGIYYFNKKDSKYFKSLVISYALLEAIRVSLLQTGGIAEIYSFLAKFILVLLALDAALLSERLEKKEGLYLALTMVGLEILLYVIFIIGFPSVRTRLLYMIVPVVGILMAGSMCIFVTGRLEQILYSENKTINK